MICRPTLRLCRRVLICVCVSFTLLAPSTAQADLRIHGEGGGAAPLDPTLRGEGAGFQLGGSIDYEVVPLLALGVFYSFADFIRNEAGCCSPPDSDSPILDHAIGARLDLRYVRHELAGWFGRASRDLYGEAFIELDLAYHNIAGQHRVGWGIGLGYRVLAAGPFGLGTYFRFNHVVAEDVDDDTVVLHLMYASFGLTVFFSFDVGGDDDEEEDDDGQDDEGEEWDEVGGGDEPQGDDDWEEPVEGDPEEGGWDTFEGARSITGSSA